MDLAHKWEVASTLYGGKVKTFARNSFRQIPDHEQNDVEQELLVVLWECVVHYDPNKGASFNTYFQQSAKNRVISLIRHYQTKGRTATLVSLTDEAVEAAVSEMLATTSAEELALMRMTIREFVLEHGEEALSRDRRRSRRAS
jgi:DNA-directed RNA polymerase specialized sigma24 family protein